MKHELLLSEEQQKNLSDDQIKTLNNYCRRQAFENSELPFPIALGFDEDEKIIIENLPDLGNIFLFGATGMADYYMQLLYLQIMNVRDEFRCDLTVFDSSNLRELNRLAPSYNYITGSPEDLVDVLNRIERAAAKRREGHIQRHEIFFIYLGYVKISEAEREQLQRILSEDLKSIGIQIIVCATNSQSTDTLLPFADYFQTTIGGPTVGIADYSNLRSYHFLMRCGESYRHIDSKYGINISDSKDETIKD